MLMQSLLIYYSHALIVSNVGSLFRPYHTSLFTQSMTLILDFLSLRPVPSVQKHLRSAIQKLQLLETAAVPGSHCLACSITAQ